jgi:prevent-host-death family protein
MTERTLTVAEAEREFAELIERVRREGESALLTKDGVAVARIVPVEPRPLTGAELAEIWKRLPHLSPEEADAFAADIEAGRRSLLPLRDPWE